MNKVGKPFIVDLLRRPFVTKEAAMLLYDIIREDITEQLMNGNTVNLFDLVYLEPYKTKPKRVPQGFGKDPLILSEENSVKSRIAPKFKNEWKELNR